MESKLFTCLTVVALLMATNALADKKMYPGAMCTYASNDTNGEKPDLAFLNDSGSGQWVVCPIVRDWNDFVDYLYIDTSSDVNSTPLFLARAPLGGTLSHWSIRNSTTYTSVKHWYRDENITPETDAVLGIAIYLPDGGYIYSYIIDEGY